MSHLFSIDRFLAGMALPFRGHNEGSKAGVKRGLFLEFVQYMADNGDEILKRHLMTAPKNATYLSHDIQNQMIGIGGRAVKSKIIQLVKEAKVFVIMMDETRDLSHVEQVIVVARFEEKGTAKVQERMLALVATHSTTGEALESFLLSVLEKCGLDVENLVGQCYDGGSNLSGVFEGVQARILEKNALAVFTHCFAQSQPRCRQCYEP